MKINTDKYWEENRENKQSYFAGNSSHWRQVKYPSYILETQRVVWLASSLVQESHDKSQEDWGALFASRLCLAKHNRVYQARAKENWFLFEAMNTKSIQIVQGILQRHFANFESKNGPKYS